jgi:hypothetical protein
VAYHAVFFTRINPAAWFFAALFVGEALAFLWFGVLKRRLAFDVAWTPRRMPLTARAEQSRTSAWDSNGGSSANPLMSKG